MRPEQHLELSRYRAWTQSRRGFLDGTDILDGLRRIHGLPLWLITDYVSLYRFRGLAPHSDISTYISEGLDLINRHPDHQWSLVVAFHEHRAYYLMTQGNLQEARTLLEEICGPRRTALGNTRILCRATATLAEVHRRLGNTAPAEQLAEQARAAQSERRYFGDMARFTLSCLAKSKDDPSQATAILGTAKAIQTDVHDGMGEARTLLLEARLVADGRRARPLKRRIEQLRRQLPALNQCPLVARIFDRWGQWTNRLLAPDESGDVYWGV